jgi:hypothetical protein
LAEVDVVHLGRDRDGREFWYRPAPMPAKIEVIEFRYAPKRKADDDRDRAIDRNPGIGGASSAGDA